MIVIEDVLISDDVIDTEFLCHLDACRGACCWEGDYGAPLAGEELQIIEDILEIIKPQISIESRELLAQKGFYEYFSKPGFTGTALHPDGTCVFMLMDEKGVSQCAFEKAYIEGKTNFKKPLSCHLYPIRVTINKEAKFEAWNYDLWDICTAACKLGAREKVPVYRFLKEAIVRYKGQDFYDQLDGTVSLINSKKGKEKI